MYVCVVGTERGGVLKRKMRWWEAGGEVDGVRRLAFVRGGGRASFNDELKKIRAAK